MLASYILFRRALQSYLCSQVPRTNVALSVPVLEFSGFGSAVVLVALALLLQLGLSSVALEGCKAAGSHSLQCDRL